MDSVAVEKKTMHMTLEEWRAEGKRLFGDDIRKWRFVCVNCGNVQSLEDFEKAGIKESREAFYFSCIGRWTGGKGTLGSNEKPCNYTNGGLFRLGPVFVTAENGEEVGVFDFDRSDERR